MFINSARYAIYYAPPVDSQLWSFGSSWLGRDARDDKLLPRTITPELDSRLIEEVTRKPRHYGFHATLKPPFVLMEGRQEAELVVALEKFAKTRRTFFLPELELRTLDGFLAFTLRMPSEAVHELADACVRDFDEFRSPPDNDEIILRRKNDLTSHQSEMLERWGYPYVFKNFRFHMTLTQCLKPEPREIILNALRKFLYGYENWKIPLDSICLFRQVNRDSPFYLIQRFLFGEDDRDKIILSKNN